MKQTPAPLLLALVSIASSLVPPLAAQEPADTFVLAKQAFLANDIQSASSLFEAAVRSRPADADRRAWHADAARRLESPSTALREAREALRLDPCNSFAHEVVAGLYNPQYAHMESQSDDSTVTHLNAAVRCDPTNGSAWMSLWVQSLRADDEREERRALDGLLRSGIITPSWLAHGRWVLRTLPSRAIVLAAGDIDTYPVAIAQGTESLRADVAVVNTSMLNIGYIVEHLVRHFGLPLPPDLPKDSLDFKGERIIAFWRTEAAAGRLDRPLVLLHSLGFEYAEKGAGTLRLTGPHWTIGAANSSIDATAVAAAFRLAESTDFSGPYVGANDRSPIRVSNAFSPALMLGYFVAYEGAANGAIAPSRVEWLLGEFKRAGVSDASAAPVLEWIRKFPVR